MECFLIPIIKPIMKKIQLLVYILFIAILAGCSKSSDPSTDNGGTTGTTGTTGSTGSTGTTATRIFAKGADIGWLSQMEASGIKFYNAKISSCP